MTAAKLAARCIHKTLTFSQSLLHESFTSKWWLSFIIETWKFIKNKLLKYLNSKKTDYASAGLNLNILFKKAPQ